MIDHDIEHETDTPLADFFIDFPISPNGPCADGSGKTARGGRRIMTAQDGHRFGQPKVIVVMGVAGAGKTTVGEALAAALGWSFLEGDSLHPPRNIDKMRNGIPLNDADRAPWLARLRERIEEFLASGERAVVTCSALRRDYRRKLRVDACSVRFVYLKADAGLLLRRLRSRHAHYMTAAMLQSQLEALEAPATAVTVDAAARVDAIVTQIRAALKV